MTFLAFLISFPILLGAQSDDSGFSHRLYLIGSKIFDDGNREDLTFLGLGYTLHYRFQSNWSVEMNINPRRWSERDKLFFPVYFGPAYAIKLSDKTDLIPYAGAGPALVVGNDYASVFGALNFGSRLEISFSEDFGFLFGVSFGQGMAFHPDSFEFIDLSAGVKF